ncbi:MAG: flagellar hook-associated protein FlgL [Planctomycetota bacterium]|nr:flagellar hook-associated protein FlgL [Planctomycetota bacterium]
MSIRPTQGRIFDLVQSGIERNTSRLIRAQEQASSGRRIVRASDDPVGTSVALSLRRQRGALQAYSTSTATAKPVVEQASARLQEGVNVVADLRALMIQGMNGALSAEDRASIATQMELLEAQLLDIANTKSGDRYLFSGTATDERAFQEETVNGVTQFVFKGNGQIQRIQTGRDADVAINVSGQEVFAKFDYTDTEMTGTTGIASGLTADSGSGYSELTVRQEGTTATMGAGITLVDAEDTLVGTQSLAVDGGARTVQLGSGEVLDIPTPTPDTMTVRDENGATVELDLSAWAGADLTTSVLGSASISIDGESFTPVNLTETDLLLRSESTGARLHVDTTGLKVAGSDLVTFSGTPSVFETIRGVVADLRMPEDTDRQQRSSRLQARLGELDRSEGDMITGLGKLGTAAQQIDIATNRLEDLKVTVRGLISNVEDADFTEVALDLQRSEQTLQLAQATGSRLMQQSLLRFL